MTAEHPTGAPLVSIVIPCFNHGRFLADAIGSALTQTYPYVEIIVVDDGSTDNSGEIARGFAGVVFIHQSRTGVASARNRGFDRSRGSFVVFLDADDRLVPEAVSVGLSQLAEQPTAAFVSGQCALIDFDGAWLPPEPPVVIDADADHYGALLRNCYIWTNAAVMYRRIALAAVGGFNQAFSASADHDLYLRLARQFRVGCHPTVVAEYRRHGTNMTRDAGRSLQERIDVLRNQRPMLKRQAHREAYQAGIRFARQYFGEPLLTNSMSDFVTRNWRRAMAGGRTLLACYPAGLVFGLFCLVRMMPSMVSRQK